MEKATRDFSKATKREKKTKKTDRQTCSSLEMKKQHQSTLTFLLNDTFIFESANFLGAMFQLANFPHDVESKMPHVWEGEWETGMQTLFTSFFRTLISNV